MMEEVTPAQQKVKFDDYYEEVPSHQKSSIKGDQSSQRSRSKTTHVPASGEKLIEYLQNSKFIVDENIFKYVEPIKRKKKANPHSSAYSEMCPNSKAQR